MTTWTCPDCRRDFGRRNAGHTCSPLLSMAEWFETSPPHERPVAERLIELVSALPDAILEPVQVGLFAKRRSTFASMRTKTRWVSLGLKLPRETTTPAADLKVQRQGSRYFHTWNLHAPGDLDAVAHLLEEAYDLDAR